MGALPKALAQKGADVRLVIPKYSGIADAVKEKMKTVVTGTVNLSWRQLYYGVEAVEQDGVTVYLSTTNGISSGTISTATAMTPNGLLISAAPF